MSAARFSEPRNSADANSRGIRSSVRKPEAAQSLERQETLQKRSIQAALRPHDEQLGDARPSVARSIRAALHSHSQPLDVDSREFMESRFGHDFSHVKVHSGAAASRSAAELHARAYTYGNQLVFADGQYAPSTPAGRRLLAHELAHTLQQDASLPSTGVFSDSNQEANAEKNAAMVLGGQAVTAPVRSGLCIARQSDGERSPALSDPIGPVLRELASTLSSWDQKGRSGGTFAVKNNGRLLSVQSKEVNLEPAPASSTQRSAPLSEADAARLLGPIIEHVLGWAGTHTIVLGRDEFGVIRVMKFTHDRPRETAEKPPMETPSTNQPSGDEAEIAAMDPRRIYKEVNKVGVSQIRDEAKWQIIGSVLPVGILVTAPRVAKLAKVAKAARHKKIKQLATERYADDVIRQVDEAEEVADAASSGVAPREHIIPVDPRVRGFAHEDLILEMKRFEYKGLPNWFKSIDYIELGTARKSYTYVDGGQTIKVYENPNIVSHKSTRITEPSALHKKIAGDIDALRGFQSHRRGGVEVVGAGQRKLIVTVDEDVVLNSRNVDTFEFWRKNARDFDFEWYVIRGNRPQLGPSYMRELGLPDY